MLCRKINIVPGLLILAGFGLILNEQTFYGVLVLLLGFGFRLADFSLAASADGPRRLVAKGSPALLMIALMLGAAKGYVVTMDALLPALSAAVTACPADMDAARLLLVRALEVLH